MNKYSFDSSGTFILKTLNKCVINNRVYEPNEIITYFENAEAQLQYGTLAQGVQQARNILINSLQSQPQYLYIGNISKQESVTNLLFSKNNKENTVTYYMEDHTVDANKTIYLKCKSNIEIQNIFIYDIDRNLITKYLLRDNIIIFDELEAQPVKVFYETIVSEAPQTQYKCNLIDLPILQGIFIVKGKINGNSASQIINFPKLKFSTVPRVSFTGENGFGDTIQFTCIDNANFPISIDYIYG